LAQPSTCDAAKLVSQANMPPLDHLRSQHVGELLGATGTTQLVDSAVAALAIALQPSLVLTSDLHDIERLLRAGGVSCNLRMLRKSRT
jgi:hypothetical protein